MSAAISRRQFVSAAGGMSVVGALLAGIPVVRAEDDNPAGSQPPLWPEFPRQDSTLVRTIVGASHRDEAKVRELIEHNAALVNAWWDWGFGDWESPLGAAAHTGRRSIAEFLIDRGARVDIFAAAMLGWTDVVKSFVAASPGIQRTLGPHGIPLLAHAEAGGDPATETLAYLESLGDAGQRLPSNSLTEQQMQVYVGAFRYGTGENERFDVIADKGKLWLATPDAARRQMHLVSDYEFYPSGVPSVRIRFAVQNGQSNSLTIVQHEPIVTARRVGT